MNELNIYEIEMLKYIKRCKSVSPLRLRLHFPFCFNTTVGTLLYKNYIIQEYKEDDEMFVEGTLLTLPGNGNYTVTSIGQTYLSEFKKTKRAKRNAAIKGIVVAIITALIGCVVTSLFSQIQII